MKLISVLWASVVMLEGVWATLVPYTLGGTTIMVDTSSLGYNSPLLAHLQKGMPFRRGSGATSGSNSKVSEVSNQSQELATKYPPWEEEHSGITTWAPLHDDLDSEEEVASNTDFMTTSDGTLSINVMTGLQQAMPPPPPPEQHTTFSHRPPPITIDEAGGLYLQSQNLPQRPQDNNQPYYYAVETPDFTQVSQKIHNIVTSFSHKTVGGKLNDRAPINDVPFPPLMPPIPNSESLHVYSDGGVHQPARPGDRPPVMTNADGFTGVSVMHIVPKDPGDHDAIAINHEDFNSFGNNNPSSVLPVTPDKLYDQNENIDNQEQVTSFSNLWSTEDYSLFSQDETQSSSGQDSLISATQNSHSSSSNLVLDPIGDDHHSNIPYETVNWLETVTVLPAQQQPATDLGNTQEFSEVTSTPQVMLDEKITMLLDYDEEDDLSRTTHSPSKGTVDNDLDEVLAQKLEDLMMKEEEDTMQAAADEKDQLALNQAMSDLLNIMFDEAIDSASNVQDEKTVTDATHLNAADNSVDDSEGYHHVSQALETTTITFSEDMGGNDDVTAHVNVEDSQVDQLDDQQLASSVTYYETDKVDSSVWQPELDSEDKTAAVISSTVQGDSEGEEQVKVVLKNNEPHTLPTDDQDIPQNIHSILTDFPLTRGDPEIAATPEADSDITPVQYSPGDIALEEAGGIYVDDERIYMTKPEPSQPGDDGLSTWFDRDPISIFDPLYPDDSKPQSPEESGGAHAGMPHTSPDSGAETELSQDLTTQPLKLTQRRTATSQLAAT